MPSASPGNPVRPATARRVIAAGALALVASGLLGAQIALALASTENPPGYRLALAAILFAVSVMGLWIALPRRTEDAPESVVGTEGVDDGQRRFSTLLDHSHDVTAVVTPDGRTSYISEAIFRLTGRTPADLIGRNTFESVHPADVPHLERSFAECLEEPGRTTRAEFRVPVADRIIWLEAIANNLLDNPAIAGVVVNIRDVTERHVTEDRLRETRTLLESIGRIARIGGWEYLIAEDQLIWSEQTYRIHEVTASAYVPTVADAILFYAPEARAEIRSAMERAIATGEPWNLILPFITDAGRRLWVNTIGHIELVSERPHRLYGTFQDVTERVENARAIERSETRYRNLFESAPVAIWEEDLTGIVSWFGELRAAGVVDLAAHLAAHPNLTTAAARKIRVHNVNQAAVAMSRAADKFDLVNNLQRLFEPDSIGIFTEELIALWNGQRTLRIEGRTVRLDGANAEIVMHLRVPEIGGQSDFEHVVVIVLDVTGQKRLEEQFRQSQKLEAIGRLAGGIAHDFNNLLTVINGFAELVLSGAAPGSDTHELTTHIRDAGLRAADLTRQLLAFSRKQPSIAGMIDLPSVVRGLTPLLTPLLAGEIQLVNCLAPVPPVEADKGQLESVIMNLVINARDAMPDGGTLTIETGETTTTADDGSDLPAGRWVVLSVADTGTGIADDVRPHLFEPFFTTKELGKGTGLGLPTVYGIVTGAGGQLRFHTAVGQGTTFQVYLPAPTTGSETQLPEPAPAPTQVLPRTADVPEDRRQERSCTILLVEDLPAVRDLSNHILTDAGFEVISAQDGPDALEKLAALPGPVDVLVTDVQMPGMNGRELAARVRAQRPEVQVLFISGYAPDQGWGSEAFLPKPFGPDELSQSVRSLVARKVAAAQ